MTFYSATPAQAPAVIVEWLDITRGDEGLTRRWTIGFLMSSTYISEGRKCVRIAQTWDEDGWADFDTFQYTDVVDIHHIGKD